MKAGNAKVIRVRCRVSDLLRNRSMQNIMYPLKAAWCYRYPLPTAQCMLTGRTSAGPDADLVTSASPQNPVNKIISGGPAYRGSRFTPSYYMACVWVCARCNQRAGVKHQCAHLKLTVE